MTEEELKSYRDNHKTAYLMTEYDRLSREITNNQELVQTDEGMAELAGEEIRGLEKQRADLLQQIISIVEEDKGKPEEIKKMVLEVRAGAGGEESAIFAYNLAEMYYHGLIRKRIVKAMDVLFYLN